MRVEGVWRVGTSMAPSASSYMNSKSWTDRSDNLSAGTHSVQQLAQLKAENVTTGGGSRDQASHFMLPVAQKPVHIPPQPGRDEGHLDRGRAKR